MSRFVTVILALLVFFSCETTAPVDDPPDTGEDNTTEIITTEITPAESSEFESIRRDIISATPDSLSDAYMDAGMGKAAGTEKGLEYRYIAWKLMNILYPEKAGDLAEVSPPSSSSFPEIFSRVESGELDEIPAEEINYLTLVLPTLAILYTNDERTVSEALENLDEAYESAQENLEGASAVNPLSSSILPPYLKAWNMEQMGNYDEALELYDDTLEIFREMYPARMGLYRVYIKQAEYDEAVIQENILMDDLYGQIEFTYYRALRLFNGGEKDEKNDSYELTDILLKTDPQNPQFLFLRARQDFYKKKYQQVLTVLDRLYSIRNQKEAAFYLLYSRTYRALDQVNDAKEIIEEGLGIYPDSEELNYEYGKVLILAGEVEQGSQLITSNSGDEDSIREGQELLLNKAMEEENWTGAEELVLKLLEIDKKDSYLMSAALIYKELGINNAALKYIEELYSRSSDPAVLPVYIAVLLQAGGNDDKVFKLINDGLEKIKDSKVLSQLYVYKSVFSSKTERLRNLISAKLEDANNVEALILIADYYIEIGDIEQALDNLHDAALIEPDNKIIQEKIDSIED